MVIPDYGGFFVGVILMVLFGALVIWLLLKVAGWFARGLSDW